MSFDIVSLFTCLPHDFLIDCINERWDEITRHTNLTKTQFISGLKICLEQNCFVFNGKFFHQTSGTPMGAPISSSIAALGVEIILEKIMRLLPFDLPFFKIYVDDALAAIPRLLVSETLEIFNCINPKVQFTCEIEVNNKLPFLDLLITRNENGSLSTEFYQKPISSGRILNFHSCHTLSLKTNVATGLIRRIFNYSPGKDFNEKYNTAKNILKSNGYPLHIINRLINVNQHRTQQSQHEERAIPHSSILQIKGLTTRIRRLIQSVRNNEKPITTSYGNCVRTVFSKLKDKVADKEKSNLIYKINCKDWTTQQRPSQGVMDWKNFDSTN